MAIIEVLFCTHYCVCVCASVCCVGTVMAVSETVYAKFNCLIAKNRIILFMRIVKKSIRCLVSKFCEN